MRSANALRLFMLDVVHDRVECGTAGLDVMHGCVEAGAVLSNAVHVTYNAQLSPHSGWRHLEKHAVVCMTVAESAASLILQLRHVAAVFMGVLRELHAS